MFSSFYIYSWTLSTRVQLNALTVAMSLCWYYIRILENKTLSLRLPMPLVDDGKCTFAKLISRLESGRESNNTIRDHILERKFASLRLLLQRQRMMRSWDHWHNQNRLEMKSDAFEMEKCKIFKLKNKHKCGELATISIVEYMQANNWHTTENDWIRLGINVIKCLSK